MTLECQIIISRVKLKVGKRKKTRLEHKDINYIPRRVDYALFSLLYLL